ncbi:DUF2111 domain-containing protein [Methanohalophilus halophilus]|uniref:DUF2111 domain-containing protein n=1 Tax=Methanohalophilus halophilus TaxID=2177 RepID=A0A1L3Q3A3_9EURY|nr:DUF2111 domain-containing protein [Methanohalophilus halophilus]APH39347.1 hypothetical protein BHR79_07550 [Methanohalophilus halophilus]RNI09584.1 DUF2111 domain-containing protein [Methanohalophilus halophilus]SDW48207.1 hypothetical protein SAMN04515625_0998 [Methanohalophilus halophilus]
MICLKICKDSTAEDLEPIASAVHSLLGIPTTIRSVNGKGIRMERGEVVDWDYTGPILEKVLEDKITIRTVPKEGVYKGKAVAVTPIKTPDGEIVGAIGVVDLVAALDILSVFREYPDIIDEVEEAKKRHT